MIMLVFGTSRINPETRPKNIRIRKRIETLLGICGFKKIISRGKVIHIATKNEARRVAETMIGMGLINSPIIPVDKSSGTKAQTVVMVVVKIGVKKSFQTKSPVCSG